MLDKLAPDARCAAAPPPPPPPAAHHGCLDSKGHHSRALHPVCGARLLLVGHPAAAPCAQAGHRCKRKERGEQPPVPHWAGGRAGLEGAGGERVRRHRERGASRAAHACVGARTREEGKDDWPLVHHLVDANAQRPHRHGAAVAQQQRGRAQARECDVCTAQLLGLAVAARRQGGRGAGWASTRARKCPPRAPARPPARARPLASTR